jgi:hypothetical protein
MRPPETCDRRKRVHLWTSQADDETSIPAIGTPCNCKKKLWTKKNYAVALRAFAGEESEEWITVAGDTAD